MSETTTRTNAPPPGANPAPPAAEEIVYASAPSEIDDDFWLEQGRLMLKESLATVRGAANALMTALGVLQGIYLGMLGFANFIPQTLPAAAKLVFFTPLLLWLLALYCCVTVAMTDKLLVNLQSPSDIRDQSTRLLEEKQRYLERAFWALAVGLVAAFALLIYRLEM
ncbi:MAG TPA: hypothetical protein VIS78_02675 [Blastocatellia bacterium]